MLLFQSTPGIAAGRIGRGILPMSLSGCFNPRPALLPGESVGSLSAISADLGFNPRPALLPGESWQVELELLGSAVSIHARHCCRANPFQVAGYTSASAFQSTPGIAAGRIPAGLRQSRFLVLFQSTPGIAAGRIHFVLPPEPASTGFNPRPALLPGESYVRGFGAWSDDVSIHARHCCRANRLRQPARWRRSCCFNPRPALLPGESIRW